MTKQLTIYITASWRHAHLVELITRMLEDAGHVAKSIVRNGGMINNSGIEFEEWILTGDATKCFIFDHQWACNSDLMIYIGGSGPDAWAEVGLAAGRGVPLIGLRQKGESIGLMRKLIPTWCNDVDQLMHEVREAGTQKEHMQKDQPAALTFGQLGEAIAKLSPVQLAQPARFFADDYSGVIRSLQVIEEDFVSVDKAPMEPASNYSISDEMSQSLIGERWLTGTPILSEKPAPREDGAIKL